MEKPEQMSVSESASPSEAPHSAGSLDIHLLGCVDFDSAVFLQERLVYEATGRDDQHGSVLVCEHPPMITVGRDGTRSDLCIGEDELRMREVECRWISRGGGTVFHAPGQLAIYPIIPLERIQLTPAAYRQALADTISAVCSELKTACRFNQHRSEANGRCGAFGHIGTAVRSGVSMHGFFLDVSTSPIWLQMLAPQSGRKRRSSLSTERVRPTEMHVAREATIRHLTEKLGYGQFHLFTGHPLLKRARRRIHDYA